jgi:hypothetical protein
MLVAASPPAVPGAPVDGAAAVAAVLMHHCLGQVLAQPPAESAAVGLATVAVAAACTPAGGTAAAPDLVYFDCSMALLWSCFGLESAWQHPAEPPPGNQGSLDISVDVIMLCTALGNSALAHNCNEQHIFWCLSSLFCCQNDIRPRVEVLQCCCPKNCTLSRCMLSSPIAKAKDKDDTTYAQL